MKKKDTAKVEPKIFILRPYKGQNDPDFKKYMQKEYSVIRTVFKLDMTEDNKHTVNIVLEQRAIPKEHFDLIINTVLTYYKDESMSFYYKSELEEKGKKYTFTNNAKTKDIQYMNED